MGSTYKVISGTAAQLECKERGGPGCVGSECQHVNSAGCNRVKLAESEAACGKTSGDLARESCEQGLLLNIWHVPLVSLCHLEASAASRGDRPQVILIFCFHTVCSVTQRA